MSWSAAVGAVVLLVRTLFTERKRNKEALEAIEQEDWAGACRATLDYYDRCYDHELARSPKRDAIDLSGLSAGEAAQTLIDRGIVEIPD